MPTDQLSRRRLDQLLRVLSKKNGWAAEGAGNGRYALLGKFKFTFRWP
ncbi:MAG TPA: hypothetical protein VIA18_22100 [Polyangia bacterium]|jgi:hypothetical protein|nr:hypothetical protein [Polyangia bacterium]